MADTLEWQTSRFLRDVEQRSGTQVSACFQCHKCSTGCPIGPDMEILSSQVMRMIHLGQEMPVLESPAIWKCASCEACTTRCPMQIDIAAVMDTLRMMAVERKVDLPNARGEQFNRSFLKSIRRNGRVYELGMMMAYKLRSRDFFSDAEKTGQMLVQGEAVSAAETERQRRRGCRSIPALRRRGEKAMKIADRPRSSFAGASYAFFPGCSLESTGWDFDRSTRAICRTLGIELVDIPDWVCCGSTPAHSTSATLSVALPVMNLQKAEGMGLPILTACASCYSRLRTANHAVQHDPDEKNRAERVTAKPYSGGVEVRHLLDVLVNDLGVDAIRAKVRRPLAGLQVACYYGCLLTRPPGIVAFDNAEHPDSMDRILEAIGAEPVAWPYKTECCGAALSITRSDIVNRLSHKLLSMARQAGAQCLAVACPLCESNLDLRQADAVKAHGPIPATPVLYVTQLLGLALGLSNEDVGLDSLFVSAEQLLAGTRVEAVAAREVTI